MRNGEKQQQIRSQDDKNVLEAETVPVESEIAKVQPFPNNNTIFSCHDLTSSGDRPISPSQPENQIALDLGRHFSHSFPNPCKSSLPSQGLQEK